MSHHKPVSLYAIPLEVALAALLQTVPERKHPKALDLAAERLQQRSMAPPQKSDPEDFPSGL